jgi:restriction system protein
MKINLKHISPEDFERHVKSWVEKSAPGDLVDFDVTRREKIPGDGGEYEIDVLVRFSILDGAEFIVLIECKKHKNPIKRDLVQILESKMRDIKAHKAILFSTSEFQSGAITFADKHNIALVQVASEATHYFTRSQVAARLVDDQVWGYVGWMVKTFGDTHSLSVITDSETETFRKWLSKND